jgi:hypothetical protein
MNSDSLFHRVSKQKGKGANGLAVLPFAASVRAIYPTPEEFTN